MDLKSFITDVPDFPKPGIMFRDVSPLLRDPGAFRHALDSLEIEARKMNGTHIVAVESRGFLFGAPLAQRLSLPVVLARKRGKLPGLCFVEPYGLEYGEDVMELQADALPTGAKAIVIDDVLATGGTAGAVGRLIHRANVELAGYLFLIELPMLAGRTKLPKSVVTSLITY